MLTAVHSVILDVADFETAVRDHETLLGRAPAAVGLDPVHRNRLARFRLSNMQLELRGLEPAAPFAASIAGIPFRDGEGLAGLRLVGRFESGAPLGPGRVEGPGVPIELVSLSETSETSVEPSVPPPITNHSPASGVDPAERIDGLDHVVIASPDPERTRRQLAEELGLRLALDRRFPERGLRLLFFRLGGVTLEVAASLAEAAPAAGGDAFHGLAWRVPRIEAVHARLSAAGFSLSEIRAGHKAGTRVASLRAPFHGVPTLLIEHPPREPVGSADRMATDPSPAAGW